MNKAFVSFSLALISSFPNTGNAQDITFTRASGTDCLSEKVVTTVLTKLEIQRGRLKNLTYFINDLSCGLGGISVGINNASYTLDKYSPIGLGLPVMYYNENNDANVTIENAGVIYLDKANSVELGAGEFCIPSYRKVKVTVVFKGQKKTSFGTALGNCP